MKTSSDCNWLEIACPMMVSSGWIKLGCKVLSEHESELLYKKNTRNTSLFTFFEKKFKLQFFEFVSCKREIQFTRKFN